MELVTDCVIGEKSLKLTKINNEYNRYVGFDVQLDESCVGKTLTFKIYLKPSFDDVYLQILDTHNNISNQVQTPASSQWACYTISKEITSTQMACRVYSTKREQLGYVLIDNLMGSIQ